jgi:hypothetical protein
MRSGRAAGPAQQAQGRANRPRRRHHRRCNLRHRLRRTRRPALRPPRAARSGICRSPSPVRTARPGASRSRSRCATSERGRAPSRDTRAWRMAGGTVIHTDVVRGSSLVVPPIHVRLVTLPPRGGRFPCVRLLGRADERPEMPELGRARGDPAQRLQPRGRVAPGDGLRRCAHDLARVPGNHPPVLLSSQWDRRDEPRISATAIANIHTSLDTAIPGGDGRGSPGG